MYTRAFNKIMTKDAIPVDHWQSVNGRLVNCTFNTMVFCSEHVLNINNSLCFY